MFGKSKQVLALEKKIKRLEDKVNDLLYWQENTPAFKKGEKVGDFIVNEVSLDKFTHYSLYGYDFSYNKGFKYFVTNLNTGEQLPMLEGELLKLKS